jgi:hypothetical protein
VIDAYHPVAPELLNLVGGLKQLFAFGFSYGAIPWINRSGYQNAFGAMAGIQIGLMAFGLPLWYWGKQIRHKSVTWKVVSW